MKKILLFLLSILSLQAMAQNMDNRVFEMRIYYAEQGKLDALIARFQKHTTKLFKKHGMENIGYWVPIHNDKNQLIYVLAYPDMAARDSSWKHFAADPKWKKVQSKSEEQGKLVNRVESIFMHVTDFSPKITASRKGDRVFELRTYTLAPDKMNQLLTRFRDHTTTLFVKHGAVNLAYWTTLEKAGIQPKLVYILAHKSESEGLKTIENFRKDPEWIKVRDDSERNGKLLEYIESVYLQALPFSRIK